MANDGFSGNKGEWSEPYVVFKLLADGKLHQADARMLPSSINYAKVIGVIRDTCSKSIIINDNFIDNEFNKNVD